MHWQLDSDPYPPPPTEREVRSFAAGFGEGPSIENFSYDYNASSNCPWNERAQFILMSDFIGVNGTMNCHRNVVKKMVKVHLKDISVKYKRFIQDSTRFSKHKHSQCHSKAAHRVRKLNVGFLTPNWTCS